MLEKFDSPEPNPTGHESLLKAEEQLLANVSELLAQSTWTPWEYRANPSFLGEPRYLKRNRALEYTKRVSAKYVSRAGSHDREWDTDITIDSEQGEMDRKYRVNEVEQAKFMRLSRKVGEIFAHRIFISASDTLIPPERPPRKITTKEIDDLRSRGQLLDVLGWHTDDAVRYMGMCLDLGSDGQIAKLSQYSDGFVYSNGIGKVLIPDVSSRDPGYVSEQLLQMDAQLSQHFAK